MKEPVEIVCIGSAVNGIDMALLKVAGLSEKPFFEKFAIGQERSDIKIIGYSLFEKGIYNKRLLEGKLGKVSKRANNDGQEYRFLDIRIQDDDFSKLDRGYSGSPICNANDEVLGVISHQRGGDKGHAFCISNLALLYPDIDKILPNFRNQIKDRRKHPPIGEPLPPEPGGGIEIEIEAKTLFEDKIEYLKDFLIEPSEPDDDMSKEINVDVKRLRDSLKRIKIEEFKKPLLIKVRGTLFPAALLTAGWWEKKRNKEKNPYRNNLPLQRWLFEGFDLWAPSWDISWDFEGCKNETQQNEKQYYVAQLTDGDEADSFVVMIPKKLAMEWREKFKKSWGGCEVEIKGLLGHRSQFDNVFPGAKKIRWGRGQADDYCIWLKDDDEKNYNIEKLDTTELYSGYLWKCLIPQKWLEDNNSIQLKDIYIAWEHTNFAAKEALKYNLSSLNDKLSYIQKLHKKDGKLILLQKSHGMFIPDEALWPVEDFYQKLMAGKSVDIPIELLSKIKHSNTSENK